MELTRQDFINIVLLASHMAKADGEFHQSEKKVLGKFYQVLHLSDEEKASLKKLSSLETSINALVSYESKEILIYVLIMIASADGKFEDEESLFIKRVMKRIGVNPMDHGGFLEDGNINFKKVRSKIHEVVEHIESLSQ